MKNRPYLPLFCRSFFSLLKGVYSPEQLCAYAAREGYSAVGMADIGNFYGLIRFIQAANRYNIKPVGGVIVTERDVPLFTAVVQNVAGFARANEIITRSLCNGPEYNPLDDLLESGWEGLYILCSRADVLKTLISAGKQGLAAALYYGRPFSGLVSQAKVLDIPTAAVNDGIYLSPGDRNLYRLLRAIDRNTTVDALGAGEALGEEKRIVTAEETARFFSAVPEALQTTADIAAFSDLSGIMRQPFVFPRFNGFTEAEAFSRLRRLCSEGVRRRYGNDPHRRVEERIRYELEIIKEKRFSSYFLVVHDIVSRYPRTCGRGSSAASIVSYLLGITHVDPLAYNLFFERFLNRGRKDPPDIDVDFPWDEREKALAYVFDTYPGRAGMVADHVTFGPRSSFREPAKAMGMEEREIGRVVKMAHAGDAASIPDYLIRAAKAVRNIPRHLGTHPGGVVITPGKITEYTHLQISPLGWPVIAWEKDATEDAGLVKIDLLGNRSLAVLRDTLELVNADKQSRPIDWESFLPLEDRETRELIERGDTLGVFYVESPATRQLLKKMQRGDYEHLVIASSIIRPAANRYIKEFVRRLKGGAYEPVHPLVEETLKETRGIMVYQEDVARVAIAVAGFSPAEADGLRKVLSKKDREIRLKAYKERFFTGGRKRNVGEKPLRSLWDMVLSFDGYSFCKAHSASYALVSYRLAYLKRYYLLEFLVSVINNGGGFYNSQVYLNEARRRGIVILPPDVNKSTWKHTVEDEAMRLGLFQIREVPEGFMQVLLDERYREGPYRDFFDFVIRLSPSFAVVRMLIRSGSVDSLAGGVTRAQLFWLYFHMERTPDLFGPPPPPDFIGDYSPKRKVYDELKTLGILHTRHPLSLFRKKIRDTLEEIRLAECIDSRKIALRAGKEVCLPGVLVTGKEVRTKQQRCMSFVSFEDCFSVYETVLFPDKHEKLLLLLEAGAVFLVVGVVREEFGCYTIEVRKLIPLGAAKWSS
jgi:DNA polymerase III alpha subunit